MIYTGQLTGEQGKACCKSVGFAVGDKVMILDNLDDDKMLINALNLKAVGEWKKRVGKTATVTSIRDSQGRVGVEGERGVVSPYCLRIVEKAYTYKHNPTTIGSHAITKITGHSAMVGCQRVTFKEANKLVKAMKERKDVADKGGE